MEKKTAAGKNGDAVDCADVPCDTECNVAWQACRENNSGDQGACNTKLAKCVTSCDSE